MSNIKVLGIDLAKNVFQLHGADARGKKVFSKRLSRAKSGLTKNSSQQKDFVAH